MLNLGCNECEQVAVSVPGPPGPPGTGTGGGGFTFQQDTPATVWTVTHNLGHAVVNVVVYSLDLLTQWDWVVVELVNVNTCRLSFDRPTSGIAYIL